MISNKMRSYWIRKGSNNRSYRHRGIWPCEDRDIDWGDVATNQIMRRTTANWSYLERGKEGSCPRGIIRNMVISDSTTVRENELKKKKKIIVLNTL